MQGVRTGPKEVKSTIETKVKNTGSFGCSENTSKHDPRISPNSGPGGEGVHGKPLFSEAAKRSD